MADPPLDSYNLKSTGLDVEISFLSGLKAEIYACLFQFRRGSRHLDFYFRSGQTMSQLTQLDTVFQDLSNVVSHAISFSV